MPMPSPKCQIYPVAGETAIKNIVDDTLFTGTGTPTLVDEGAEKAWSIPTGTLLEQAIPAKTIDGGVVGNGVAIAIRFKLTANGSGTDFMPLIGVKTSAGTIADNSVTITRNGANAYRGRTSAGLPAAATSKANNTIHTLVYKPAIDQPALDVGKIWWNTVGRVDSAPNAVSPGANFGVLALAKAYINCQGGAAFTLLDFAYFDVEPTDADCAAIADDYRAVMPAPGGGTTPIAFTGTIPAQTFTNGQAVSVNLASYFTGTQTPFTFANTGAALTGTGLSISSAGLLTGTATTGSVTGVIVTGTDADLDTASSNAFNVTVSAASTPVSFSGTIPAITGTQNTAITPVNASTYFSGSLTPFTYSLFSGTLPSGVTLNSSTGVISGTPTVSFSGNIVVRATDSGSNTADSNSIAVTIAAAAGTITSEPLTRNNGTAPGVVSLSHIDVRLQSTGALIIRKTGVSTNGSSVFTLSDAAITTGSTYIVSWLESGGEFGIAYNVVAS